MAKRKKKSKQLLKTINQNGSGPESPFLELKKVESLDDAVEMPHGATVFTVGGSEVVAFHTPAPEGQREKIFVRGFKRYPTWHEMSSAAQLMQEGTMWVAAVEPNMSFMVVLLDIDGMVDKGQYDVIVRMFMHMVNESGGGADIPFNGFKKMDAFLESGGILSLDSNAQTGNYEARLIFDESAKERPPEA